MRFWVWWYVAGLLVTIAGIVALMFAGHQDWMHLIASIFLPGMWIVAFAKPALPAAVLHSSLALVALSATVQLVAWHVVGVVVRRFRR